MVSFIFKIYTALLRLIEDWSKNMTTRLRLRTVFCGLLTIGLFPPLIAAEEPGAGRKLIPGYIDAKGAARPEKLLSLSLIHI